MPNVQDKKLLGITKNGEERKILVTHVTIRESITFLFLRLVILEVITAVCIILFHLFIVSPGVIDTVAAGLLVFNTPLFIFLVFIKTVLLIFIIVQWLNEYYEITPLELIHKKGLIFRREEKYNLSHLGSLKLDQNVIGRIFNYGSLRLYNWALEKDIALYLIHNPRKYNRILRSLIPDLDQEKKVFREHLIEKETE
ncbi:MAG: PH domain-containing protein [Candidatus Curtissbacteria bacterium]